MIKSLFIFLCPLAVSASPYLPKDAMVAGARSCRAVDYRARLGPARTMGSNGYCFAYSSSILITQRTGRDVSAIDLATGFYLGVPAQFDRMVSPAVRRELGPDYALKLARETYRNGVDVDGPLAIFPHLEGGFEASTLAWANARGLCEDRHLPAQDGTDAYAALMSRMARAAAHGRGPAGDEVEGVSARFRGAVNDRFHVAWLRFARARCQSRPSPVDLLPVDFGLAQTSREFRRARREGRVDDADQTRVLTALDFALDHHRVAAIGFDLNTVQNHAGYVDDDGDHSVAVVGRRAVKAECQYLIRDSAGDACSEFDPAIRPRCAGAHYWLNESELRRSLYSVTYLR